MVSTTIAKAMIVVMMSEDDAVVRGEAERAQVKAMLDDPAVQWVALGYTDPPPPPSADRPPTAP